MQSRYHHSQMDRRSIHGCLKHWDDTIWMTMVEKVIVGERVEFVFYNGMKAKM